MQTTLNIVVSICLLFVNICFTTTTEAAATASSSLEVIKASHQNKNKSSSSNHVNVNGLIPYESIVVDKANSSNSINNLSINHNTIISQERERNLNNNVIEGKEEKESSSGEELESSPADQKKEHSERKPRELSLWSSSNNADEPSQADCEAARRPAIYGLRCDEGGEINHDGALIIKANEPTQLLLIGKNFDLSNISVALTPTVGQAQEDCTHMDRVKSLQMHNLSSTIAQITIDLPSPGSKVPYYLCLRESKELNATTGTASLTSSLWYHQGSDSWLKLYVKQDFLPLYMKIFVIACLLMLSGLFSGLNLGLMALDKNELQVIISCGSETEKRYARAIEPVRRRGNYLLCSILFSNVLVNSTIAVLLEELTSGIVAVMTSTIFIVMFGEILPQAFCSRHGLAVGAKTVLITYFCMIVTFPLSYPVSKCLDWALGEEISHAYDRERLMEFIRVTRDYNNLEADEVNIISGALKLRRIQLSEVMTRIEDVFMLDIQACLDFNTIQAIIEAGYSRIPVHEANNRKNIVALLFAKDLALLDPDNKTPVQSMISFYNHPLMYLFEDTTLDLALNEFKTGKSHMAFIRRVIDDGVGDPIYEITGIVTLEDVIEEIMQIEINDETDTLTDNRKKRRRKEAQVRKDFSQFTNIGGGDLSHNIVTPQLCLAAYQYLATTVEPFSIKYISDLVLKRLLSQKIFHKVEIENHPIAYKQPAIENSYQQLSITAAAAATTTTQTNNSTTTNKERRLYTAGLAADYFIMILEGRVHVVCGRESLVFDGGPFNYFGIGALTTNQLLLDTAASLSSSASRKESSGAAMVSQQKGQLLTRRESVVASAVSDHSKSNLNGQFSISMKRLEQSVNEAECNYLTTSSNASSAISAQVPSKLKASESKNSVYSIQQDQQQQQHKQSCASSGGAHFVPDYTVDIVANTSYLKITRSEYLAALRATLVERDGGGGSGSLTSEQETSVTAPDSITTTTDNLTVIEQQATNTNQSQISNDDQNSNTDTKT